MTFVSYCEKKIDTIVIEYRDQDKSSKLGSSVGLKSDNKLHLFQSVFKWKRKVTIQIGMPETEEMKPKKVW